jgi:MFS family permease
MSQFCFLSFFITVLAKKTDLTPADSGPILALAFIVSIAARLGWGWLADLLGSRLVLGVICLAIGVLAVLTTTLDGGWSFWAIAALGAGYGATSNSWNGVYLAEVSRSAPVGKITTATSGAMFFTLLGALIGPAVFSLLTALTDDYIAGFAVIAASTSAAGLALLWSLARQRL